MGLSPAPTQAKPGDSIFVKLTALKDCQSHSLAPDPVKVGDKPTPAQEFVMVPFEQIIFVLPR